MILRAWALLFDLLAHWPPGRTNHQLRGFAQELARLEAAPSES